MKTNITIVFSFNRAYTCTVDCGKPDPWWPIFNVQSKFFECRRKWITVCTPLWVIQNNPSYIRLINIVKIRSVQNCDTIWPIVMLPSKKMFTAVSQSKRPYFLSKNFRCRYLGIFSALNILRKNRLEYFILLDEWI